MASGLFCLNQKVGKFQQDLENTRYTTGMQTTPVKVLPEGGKSSYC
jgi:hypothetical protein